MCFLPKSQASNDQAPGPIIARLAPRTPSTAGRAALFGTENAIQTSAIATKTPATGVHKPASSKAPASAPILCGTRVTQIDVALAQAKQE
jgi:hypothetical protein